MEETTRGIDKVEIYEQQLVQLEEQLQEVTIERNDLEKKVKELKMLKSHQQLEEQLRKERLKCQQLASKLRESEHARNEMDDWIDVAEIVNKENHKANTRCQSSRSRSQRLEEWLYHIFYTIIEDFSSEEDDQKQIVKEEPLSVKGLKENVQQFRNDTRPIFNILTGLRNLLTWQQPIVTLVTFLVYMYTAWHGWLIPLLLFLMTFRLFINFLKYRVGLNVRFHYLQTEEIMIEEEKELGIKEKINIVLYVARKVQNKLANVSHGIQKIKNLLTWQTPEQTRKILCSLSLAFVASCVLPARILFLVIAFQLGIKLFITDALFARFPRIKKKYDNVYVMWHNLKADEDLVKLKAREHIDRSLAMTPSAEGEGRQSTPENQSRIDDKQPDEDMSMSLQVLFDLPDTEQNIRGWEGGRYCTLVDQTKSILQSFTYGRLYLSKRFLCFGAAKEKSKTIIIPLKEITKARKFKPFSWMPGKGMSIEITALHIEKPYVFGGLLLREEAFNSLMTVGSLSNMPWASQFSKTPHKEPTPTKKIRMSDLEKED